MLIGDCKPKSYANRKPEDITLSLKPEAPDIAFGAGEIDEGEDIIEFRFHQGIFGVGEGRLGIDDVTVIGNPFFKPDECQFELPVTEFKGAMRDLNLPH